MKTTSNSRRRTIAAVSALLLAAATLLAVPQAATATNAAGRTSPKPTIVLVHGAWADGSTWSSVVKGLQILGYTVAVPPNPLRGVAADTASLDAFLNSITGPVVLVGHSYGGFVITNAATGDPDVKALVYVDAFAPDQGESIDSLNKAVPGALSGPVETVFATPVPIPNGGGDADLYVQPKVFIDAFTNGVNSLTAKALASSQRPLAGSTITEPSGVPAWKTIPSWYVEGTKDRVILPGGQEFMAGRAHAKLTKINAGHLSIVTNPLPVVGVIVSAVKATD